MNFLKTNETVLHYELRGTGDTTLVFSNSLGTDYRIWDDVVRNLEQDFTILLYDKRGHGLSALASPPYSLDQHVADLAALVEHLDLKKLVICGLSFGGMIAQGFYAAHPDRVKGLILCDTGHKIGTAEAWQTRIEALQQNGYAPMLDDIMARWFTESFRRDDNPVYQGCRTMLERQDLNGYTGTCAAIRDTDLTEEARKIAVPTLCVVGDEDLATPPALVEEMAGLIPGADYRVITNAGHIPCVEQPQATLTLIREFITKRVMQETVNG
ncbi:3-oxoadipate enol-lactonase [Sneathiella chinensis]|uniref:3-oxoadipate enol-lactonase n=1 Tax=Sneathiella chinensis TaxID=349750 RepID=A0ABQ5U0H1_9PROT|nr:3-oxoadipate enol-lactonase [Sneathiella chinensis]GLQ04809.1 3-oxoadipate enol-lactonase [Sneathiella chinensis]